ncbi:hypothetical protein BGX28_005815 [Mortierella sp. GBA30]|nr:hypothetical protein BGX28_005815 [Mortierella sp. GBA30]
MMRWGLIPRHAKSMPDYGSVLKSINARDDSLFAGPTGKPMFSHSKNHKRCIVLAEGFYEWRRRGKERVPFYTRRRDGGLMLMAAIYDVATIQGENEPMYTYATITTNASPQLDWLHDRMPVLIPNHDHDKIRTWLDPNLTWNARLEAMLKPCDEFMDIEETDEDGRKVIKRVYALETYQVDEKVNSVRNDSPEFAQPWNSSSNKKTLNRFFTSKAEGDSALGAAKGSKGKVTQEDSDARVKHEHLQHGDSSSIVMADQGLKEETVEEALDRLQEQVSVAADDSQRDSGFDVQESAGDSTDEKAADNQDENTGGGSEEDEMDNSLKLALELSRKEQEECERATSTRSRDVVHDIPYDSSPESIHDDSPGLVDMHERRRKEQQKEDEEMRKVLEMSLLEAIADGHEDTTQDNKQVLRTSQEQELARKEQEEFEQAIAASLAGTDSASGTVESPPNVATPSPSAAMPSSSSKTGQTSTPTTPRKRKSVASSATPNISKKGKPSQDTKITNFFQPASPP